jgi:hypothetical protein
MPRQAVLSWHSERPDAYEDWCDEFSFAVDVSGG